MTKRWVSLLTRWWLPGGLLLALGLGLAAPTRAKAEIGVATITLTVPGAPDGAWVIVQWQDRAGTWREVEGWQRPLELTDDASAGFAQLAVFPKDYGRGPFRWVVYSQQGGPVWATSSSFFLPDGDGTDYTISLAPRAAAPAGGAGGETGAVGSPTGGAAPGAFGLGTIAVNVPGAPEGAWVGVQWQDRQGAWQNVEAWQGPLEAAEETGVASKVWGVYPKDFGRGPFRWVVYTQQGGEVLGTSQSFNLPQGNNANHVMTVLPTIAVAPADTLTAEMGSEPATYQAEMSTRGLNCPAGPCDFSVLSVSVPDAPAGSKVVVQWQDGLGGWHDVRAWRGSLHAADSGGPPTIQWSASSDLAGQGPFRWVIYNPLGDRIVGVSPSFTIPEAGGVELSLNLSR